MIPKVFHLTAKSKSLKPGFQRNVDRIKEIYSEFDVIIYDDEDIDNFLKKADLEYYHKTILNMPKYIMVVDTVRYLWMRELGGIYCDMDVFFQQRIDFGESPFFIEREWTWPQDHSIVDSVHNCIFASPPRHPIWDHLLEGIADNIVKMNNDVLQRRNLRNKLRKFFGLANPARESISPVFNATGPNAISKIITNEELLKLYPDVKVSSPHLLYQAGLSTGEVERAYVVHQTAASWKEIG